MLYYSSLVSMLEGLVVTVPVLLTVAYVTVAESKTMASMQSSLGPNMVGYYGLLQAFADALKLMLKEYVAPTQANLVLFFLGPVMTLMFSLLGYAVMPFAPGLSLFDFNLGMLFMLAVSSLATYGMLLAGWSANSKYAFLGSLSSTAQLISYELVLSSAMFLVMLFTNSLNLTASMEAQSSIWLLVPLAPIFIIFFIAAMAETNSAPFDLAEAESELVSGFMTEHSAVVFVFFFLAEYASIVLMCVLTSMLFLGGYLFSMDMYIPLTNYLNHMSVYISIMAENYNLNLASYSISTRSVNIENLAFGLALALKSFMMAFVFMWVSASFPSISYDQLMSYCWTMLLPIVFAFMLLAPCLMYVMKVFTNNILLF